VLRCVHGVEKREPIAQRWYGGDLFRDHWESKARKKKRISCLTQRKILTKRGGPRVVQSTKGKKWQWIKNSGVGERGGKKVSLIRKGSMGGGGFEWVFWGGG